MQVNALALNLSAKGLGLFLGMLVIFPPAILARVLDEGAEYQRRAINLRKSGDYQEAIIAINNAIRLSQDKNSRAAYLDTRAYIHHDMGKFDDAIADDEEALRLVKFGVAHFRLGRIWLDKGDCDKAITYFNLAFSGTEVEAHEASNKNYDFNAWIFSWRAFALSRKGKYVDAIRDFDEALRLNGADFHNLRMAAWFRATCPDAQYRDGVRAVANSMRACELSGWKNFLCLDTLASAYAERGDFESAVMWEEKAIALRPSRFGWKAGAAARLELFKLRKPYRDDRCK
jgi:tetratricopeptide (TPR) repeat protein